jgi:SAM-dependent methyltransferase
MTEEDYFNYLKTRSNKALLYRTKIIYPYIGKYLPGKVLDIGCGIGDYLGVNKNSVGIDINFHNVNYCKQLGFDARKIENNVFPVEENEFDSAILDNVLEHLTHPEITLNEVRRALKVGGKLLLGVPGVKGYTMDSDHKKFYDEKEMQRLLTANGFMSVTFLYTPTFFKSQFISERLGSYCVYGVFEKL